MKRLLLALALVAASAGPALADPAGDVRSAMLEFAKLTSFHMSASSQGKTVEADFLPPGKAHFIMPPLEVITIDGTVWAKINGTWQTFAFPGITQLTGTFSAAIDALRNPSADMTVTDLGEKTVDGTQLHAYGVTSTSGGTPSTVYIDANGRLVRAEGGSAGVVRFSRFNAPLEIDPPA